MLRVVRKQYAQRALGSARQMSSNSTSPGTAVTEVVHPAHQREPLPAEVISGAPSSLTKRTVRIYRPSNNPMQSGKNANL
ncbi:hypothetical protein LPJ71_010276, partial [Coemansia sp. S17]